MSHEAEFDSFVSRHYERLLRCAWALSGNPHDAEEIVQGALLRILERYWSRLVHRSDGERLQYVLKAVKSEYYNLTGRTARGKRNERRYADLVARDRAVVDPTAELNDEDCARIYFAGLRPVEGRVVWLLKVEGYSASEVAGILSIKSIGTVKSICSRAIEKIRQSAAHSQAGDLT